MVSTDGLRLLLERAAAGDERAAEQILHSFASPVLRAVRLRLNRRLRRDFDSVDFVQAVWMSFFDGLSGVERFENPRALCGYLTKIAERKVLLSLRHRSRQKRDASREQPLETAKLESSGYAATGATPSEQCIALETWERLMMSLPIQHQRILSLRIHGHSHAEIAGTIGVAEITVRRVLAKLKKTIEA